MRGTTGGKVAKVDLTNPFHTPGKGLGGCTTMSKRDTTAAHIYLPAPWEKGNQIITKKSMFF